MKIQILCGMIALALVAGCKTDQEKSAAETAPKMGTRVSDLPLAVQNTIRREAPNAKIDDIDKETRSGRVVYEITFAEPGKNPKMHIAADGTLLKSDSTIYEKSGAPSNR